MKKTPMRFSNTNIRGEHPKRRIKSIGIWHSTPTKSYGEYILLPVGRYYNTEVQKAKKGDVLKFIDANKVIVGGVYELNTSQPYCDALCRLKYGIGIVKIIDKWKGNAISEGNDTNVIDESRCLMVTYK